MIVSAQLKTARISAQKVRLVANEIRGLSVEKAEMFLKYSTQKSAKIVKKVLDSVISNAEHNHGADIDELSVKEIFIDEGPTFKRGRARAKGRGTRILKRTSHITIKVGDENS